MRVLKPAAILKPAVVAFALTAAPALAQETNCDNPQTQTDMNYCASVDYQRADHELNDVWSEAIAMAKESDLLDLPDDGRPGFEETLRKAQRAWIPFRDASCEYEGFAARGGSMEPMLVSLCLARMTSTRSSELRQLIQEMGTQ